MQSKPTDELTIEVVCTELPGIKFADYEPVYLGIQKGVDVIEAVPGDTKRVVFKPVFRIAKQADGSPNFLGPFAQGTPQQRFFYLSWGVMHQDHRFEMFRRAKIHLSHLRWDQVRKAMSKGAPLKATLKLTGTKGDPVCGSVRSANIVWKV
ncbi:MAG TPA: DUF5990 family protein [Blastocatellia bacterium]|nr:DUF5990 family protein [Blastocatellia bacterium]